MDIAPAPVARVPEIRRAVQRLARRLRAERPADGLPSSALSVLAQLHDLGSLTAGELSRAARSTPQALTRPIELLVREGYVHRSPADHDRRQHLLTITAEGRAALAKDAAPRDAWLDHAMATVLSPTEARMLAVAAELMDRLVTHDPTDPEPLR